MHFEFGHWQPVWCGGLALALCTFLSGCAAPPHRSVVSEIAPPAGWAAPAAAGEFEDEWWKYFDDTNVIAVVEEALRNNHDLKQALARLDAAMAEAQIAGADVLPSLALGIDPQRQQQVFVGLPIPGAGDRVLKSRATSYRAGLNLSWELDLWGRVRAGQRAALAQVQVSENDWRAARHSLASQAAGAWIAVLESGRQRDLARAAAESYRVTAERVRERYERGIRPALDLRLALASQATANGLVSRRESEMAVAVRRLEILLGRYPAGLWHETNGLPAIISNVPAGIPSDLLERRPDLVAAERRLAAATARTSEARRALFPRIALTASAGRASSQLEDLLRNDVNIWAIAANFAQPLFEGGRLRANVRLKEARTREAVEYYIQTVLRAFGEVETALAEEQKLSEREQALAVAAGQSEAARRLAEDRYRSGIENFITLLESQRRALESESALLEVRRRRLENRIELHLALGGGFGAAVKSGRDI